MEASTGSQRPLRLLSLDGGGVRGLSSLIILKHLMRAVSAKLGYKIEPWRFFDMIGGTSTGGLIAIMLGPLKMSVEDCEKSYLRLSEGIFNPKRHSWNMMGKGKDFVLADGKFDSNVLTAEIKKVITQDCMLSESSLLKDADGTCKVFVCATRVQNSDLAVLRTYDTTLPETLYNECKIWEACRATSAAPTFFDPIRIGPYDQEFIDGGLHSNNPIAQVYREARELWPSQIKDAVFISIGTGSAPGGAFEGNLKNIVEALKKIVTEAERASDEFFDFHEDLREGYFRFNVFHGLESVGLEEYDQKARIADCTQTYLNKPDTSQKIKNCVNHLLTTTPAVGEAPNFQSIDESNQLCEQLILSTLAFSGMEERIEGITDPYRETFKWIYNPAAHNFVEWIQSGQGVFWINGKAGCGKSTLMKYLFTEQNTYQILSRLHSNVYPVGFFFYEQSDNLLLKSQLGLLRSIVHQILEEYRVLIPVATPERWADMQKKMIKNTDIKTVRENTWTFDELKQALSRIVAQQLIPLHLIFFIDGLDEYQGDPDLLLELVLDIIRGEKDQSTKIQICVSSRPHRVYELAFENTPSLSVHELTKEDISRYSRETLKANYREDEVGEYDKTDMTDLVQEIVEKSSGIFLWVTLVLKSLVKGLRNLDTMAMMKRRLDELPSGLENLFERMISKVDDLYAADASLFFRLALCARHELTALGISFAVENPKIAITNPFRPNALSPKDIARRIKKTSVHLNTRCNGLVEAYEAKELEPDFVTTQVRFIHLSVHQFLQQTSMQVWLDKRAQQDSVSVHERIVSSSLRELQLVDMIEEPNASYRWQDILLGLVELVVGHAREFENLMCYPLSKYVEALDAKLSEVTESHHYITGKHWPCTRYIDWREPEEWNTDFMAYMVKVGMNLYVRQQIERGYDIHSKAGRPLIFYAVFPIEPSYETTALEQDTINPNVVGCLLENGAEPNKLFHSGDAHSLKDRGAKTPWQAALLCAYKRFAILKPGEDSWQSAPFGASCTVEQEVDLKRKWLLVLKLFLEYGADAKAKIRYDYWRFSALYLFEEAFEGFDDPLVGDIRKMLLQQGARRFESRSYEDDEDYD